MTDTDHKYNFGPALDWSPSSDNGLDPLDHVPFSDEKMRDQSLGHLFARINHRNSTQILLALLEKNTIQFFVEDSLWGKQASYTHDGVVRSRCMSRVPTSSYNYIGVYSLFSGFVQNMVHLEQIFNHAIHILYAEAKAHPEPCFRVEGNGFRVAYEERFRRGFSLVDSSTRIEIIFLFNTHPVQVEIVHKQGPSPGVISIRSAPEFSYKT